MHKIEIVDEEKLYITIDIDSKKVRFTRRGNPDAVYSAGMISEDLDHLLEAISSGQALHEVSFHLAGTNVIRLIDTFCLDAALLSWRNYAEATMDAYCCVRAILYQYLGFTISSHLQDSPFCIEAKKIGVACKKEKVSRVYHNESYFNNSTSKTFRSKKAQLARNIQRSTPFDTNGFHIEYMKRNTMHCVFLVNGIELSLSLSRMAHSLTPKKLYDLIIRTRDNLMMFDYNSLEKLSLEKSGRVVLCIMLALYKNEALIFLTEAFRSIYKNYRRIPEPRRMLKTMFHCSLMNIDGVDVFLSMLELLIPEAEQYLLDTTNEEIESDKDAWILFHPRPGSIMQFAIQFGFGEPLNQELRDYLRAAAKSGIKSGVPIAQYLSGKWLNIRCALVAFKKMGVLIHSITDIRPADCISLQSYYAQCSSMNNKTQRNSLLEVKAFFQFVADQLDLDEKNPFDYIHLPRRGDCNHTPPITDEALTYIEDRIAQLPLCYRLAFSAAVHTGARASSICALTTDAIVKENDIYYLVIFHNKTSIKRTYQNRPNTTKHEIDQDFACSLLRFISETEVLRSQLDKPYIFIYTSPALREGSKRKPKVLTHSAFTDQIEKLLEGVPLFRTDGTPVRCNFMSIRAAVGHAMFLKGDTAEDVAKMLGNTPKVAAINYNTMTEREEAGLYNRHYGVAFAGVRTQIEKRHTLSDNMISFPDSTISRPVMYGKCESNEFDHCNKNDCNNCRQRIVCQDGNQRERSPTFEHT